MSGLEVFLAIYIVLASGVFFLILAAIGSELSAIKRELTRGNDIADRIRREGIAPSDPTDDPFRYFL